MELTSSQAHDIGTRKTAALWYAWGRLDQAGVRDALPSPDRKSLAFTFADEQETLARAHYVEGKCMYSVQDEWTGFAKRYDLALMGFDPR